MRLGRNPARIQHFAQGFGHKFELFEKRAADAQQGQMLPLAVTTAIVKPDVRRVIAVARSRMR